MAQKPFLSVIIPSYDEMKNLKRGILDEVKHFLDRQSYNSEIILTDDGSTDGTIDFLRSFANKYQNIQLLLNHHAGKGPTVKTGMLAANGEWRLFTDLDQSTPISEINKLIQHCDQFPIIIGSREGKNAHREKEPIHRHLMGRVFNFVVQIFTIPGIKDTQCGFKLFSEQATVKLFNKLNIYARGNNLKTAFTGAFDVELLYLAKKYNYKIKEVPIIWKHYQSDRVDPLRDSAKMFTDVIKIRIADLRGKYQ